MNIYVSNLSFEVENNDLQALFEEFGEVSSASIILDKITRRSRGFGFVEMPKSEEAEAAIKEINGTQLKGRAVTAAQAREREERSNSGYSPFKSNSGSGYNRR